MTVFSFTSRVQGPAPVHAGDVQAVTLHLPAAPRPHVQPGRWVGDLTRRAWRTARAAAQERARVRAFVPTLRRVGEGYGTCHAWTHGDPLDA